MPEPQFISGNIFTTEHQTIVNTVNCVGVMGAGIALEFRLRYPDMYEKYVAHCKAGQMRIGSLWLYKTSDRWVLNFPTKKHWRFPTKEEYLHAGLEKFCATYEERGITSIAFPLLGTHHGGLEPERCRSIMLQHLSGCRIPVEIYLYDPFAVDDLYERFKVIWLGASTEAIRAQSQLGPQYIERIRHALDDPAIRQMNQLARVKGIGPVTLARAFAFARDAMDGLPSTDQQSLDFESSQQ